MKTKSSTTAHRSARRQSQESRILEHIKFLPQTLKSLHEITGIDKSTIAARLSALQERGVVTGFDTVEVSNGKGQLVTVTLYDYEPDEHRQIDHAHARRRNLAIARIESSLKNDLEFLPQYLVAAMRAFLQLEKELGQLDSDYKQPEGARPPDKFTGV